MKCCLPPFLHAGSVPARYEQPCPEQWFQLSTCPACPLGGRPSTKPEADYAPHGTYVLRSCVLESNYQCHCCALRERGGGVGLAGASFHVLMWRTEIRLEVRVCWRSVTTLHCHPHLHCSGDYPTSGWAEPPLTLDLHPRAGDFLQDLLDPFCRLAKWRRRSGFFSSQADLETYGFLNFTPLEAKGHRLLFRLCRSPSRISALRRHRG